ncbi:MAG: hypothetical protein SFU25_05210, partial [Candidatus Caenarcaniphilales bacterium]|nr:hypothetical protein [Candidatus Caenarcaniphilales bacterium]
MQEQNLFKENFQNLHHTKEIFFPRSEKCPSQTPLYWVTQKSRYLRQLLISDIIEVTKRPLIVYFTNDLTGQIDFDDIKYFAELLKDIPDEQCKNGIDIFLETPGGIVTSAEEIVKCIRNRDIKNFRTIIARRAKSCGTLISLGSSEIVMGPDSQLGPIDPWVHGLAAKNIIKDTRPDSFYIIQDAISAIKQTKQMAFEFLAKGMLKNKEDSEIHSIVGKLSFDINF